MVSCVSFLSHMAVTIFLCVELCAIFLSLVAIIYMHIAEYFLSLGAALLCSNTMFRFLVYVIFLSHVAVSCDVCLFGALGCVGRLGQP